jgi:hypothetical protein
VGSILVSLLVVSNSTSLNGCGLRNTSDVSFSKTTGKRWRRSGSLPSTRKLRSGHLTSDTFHAQLV